MSVNKNKSNPILESILLALMLHFVALVVMFFSDDILFVPKAKADNNKTDAQIEFIELTEELLALEQETPQDDISQLIDKYKNVTAKANSPSSNKITDFNKKQIDEEVQKALDELEKTEKEKLAENHKDPTYESQLDPKDKKKKDDPKDKKKRGGEGESYASAATEFDFSRDPDFRKTPSYRCYEFGRIVVEISVDINGNVVSAKAVSGDLGKDCLKSESEAYAKRWKFAAKFDAPKAEKGTITFTFFPQ